MSRRCTPYLFPLLALLIPAAVGPARRRQTEELSLFVYQARAFLQGRLDLERDPEREKDDPDFYRKRYHDSALYEGRYYVPFPPFPALVLVPFVAVFGTAGTNVVLVAMALSVLNVVLLTRILGRLGIDEKAIPWLTSAFFLGTAYWMSMLWSSGVWFFAHIVAVSGMFLAIDEALGKGRGLLVGLYLGTAFLSRQLSIYSFLFLAAAVWHNAAHQTRKSKLVHLASLSAALGVCVLAYLVLNTVRFGSPFDTGYGHVRLSGFLEKRVARFGLFHPVYVPSNFVHMFVQGFHVRFAEPTGLRVLKMDPFGTSLTFASPFVFFALAARWDRRLLWAAWASVVAMLGQMLFYYNNGWSQVNAQRFTLDFLPVLIVLVALGTRRARAPLWKGAVACAIVLNVVALFGVPALRQLGARL